MHGSGRIHDVPLTAGGDARHATLVDEATARFGGTTLADVKEWSREDRLVDRARRRQSQSRTPSSPSSNLTAVALSGSPAKSGRRVRRQAAMGRWS
jgi:hypothetical protein